MSQQDTTAQAFQPSEKNMKSLMDWFAKYDGHVLKNELDRMADMAFFPIIVMTDDSAGNCVTQNWDRDTFKQAMDLAAQGVDVTTLKIQNHRNPTFLSENLAVVVTDAVTTVGETTQQSRYVDIMVKQNGEWKYKSMAQAGWGDMLKQYFGAA